MKPYKQ